MSKSQSQLIFDPDLTLGNQLEFWLIAEQKRIVRVYELSLSIADVNEGADASIPVLNGGSNQKALKNISLVIPSSKKMTDQTRQIACNQANKIGVLADKISREMKRDIPPSPGELFLWLSNLRSEIKPTKNRLGFTKRNNEDNKMILESRKQIDAMIKIVEKQLPHAPKLSLREKIMGRR